MRSGTTSSACDSKSKGVSAMTSSAPSGTPTSRRTKSKLPDVVSVADTSDTDGQRANSSARSSSLTSMGLARSFARLFGSTSSQ